MTERTNGEHARLRNVLHTIARQAQHAAITGALDGGEARCVWQYNHIARHCIGQGLLDDPVYRATFAPLPNDAGYEAICVSAGLLEKCLDGAHEDADNDTRHPYRSAHHILQAVGKMAEKASVTGHLAGGRARLAGLYNAVQGSLGATGVVPEDLFDALDEESGTMGEVAVAAQQLAAYVEDGFDESDPQLPDVPRTGRELKDIGQLVREAMPEWMHAEVVSSVDMMQREITKVVEDIQADKLTDVEEIRRRMAAIQQPRIPSPPTPPTPPTPPVKPDETR
jgi:hypothetical protein